RISKTGENIQVIGFARFANPSGRIGSYVHHNFKVGALISVTSSAPAEQIDALLKQLGMHIASSKPTALTRDQVSAELVDRERTVYRESDDLKGKPADKVEMIIKGKLEK